jgi:hypothetical protein
MCLSVCLLVLPCCCGPVCADGTSRVSLELPCLSEAIVQTMLGPQLLSKATNGKKQLQVHLQPVL